MDISIVIASWNVQEHLRRCLKSILAQPMSHSFEVIVVDNASSDQSAQMILNEFPQVKLIVNEKNLGFATAVNQGVAASQGAHILLLNPDTEVRAGSLDAVLDAAGGLDKAAVIGGLLLNPDGTTQASVRRFPTLASQWLVVLKLHHLFPKIKALRQYYLDDFDYTKSQAVDQVMGAYFLVPRAAWEALGGLDQKFFVWFEEVDFCLRASRAGWSVYFLPIAPIIHYGGQSFSQLMGLHRQVLFNRSLRYYFKKHGNVAAYALVLLLQPLSVFLAVVAQILARPSYRPKPRPLSDKKAKEIEQASQSLFKMK